jgi:putative transposase
MRKNRLSHRLPGYDYRRPDPYFITACVKYRECLFGAIRGEKMLQNPFGQIVQACWDEIPAHFPNAVLDAFVVMPNHIHGIIWIVNGPISATPSVGMTHASSLRERINYARSFNPGIMPARGPLRGSIGAMVGSFKSAVTRRINKLRYTPGMDVWQYNYHERIIRTESSLQRIRRYINMNPMKWQSDNQNPNRQDRGS